MWHCSCGCINAGLVQGDCAAAKTWTHLKHYQISDNTFDEFRVRFELLKLRKELQGLTPQEELFATYYNRGKVLVKDMEDHALREHRAELSKIAIEAKAQLLAADDEIRDRDAKSGKSKEWLVTVDTSTSVSDAINVPKQRAAKMSQMDKLRKQLLAAKLDEATVNEMVKQMSAKATGANPTMKTVVINRPTTEMTVIQVEAEKPKPEEPEPFNWASLTAKCSVCKQNPCRCDGLQPVEK